MKQELCPKSLLLLLFLLMHMQYISHFFLLNSTVVNEKVNIISETGIVSYIPYFVVIFINVAICSI